MVTGLQPLEFKDCQLDSPEFRENLNKHEKVLDKTSQQIKRIIKEVNFLLTAAKSKGFYAIYTIIIYRTIDKECFIVMIWEAVFCIICFCNFFLFRWYV